MIVNGFMESNGFLKVKVHQTLENPVKESHNLHKFAIKF